MCLLIVLSQMYEAWPLVIAANRDEWLARPTTPITVLSECDPRILGGRDEVAGGTWLATNEHGVVAGLTNRPPGPAGRQVLRSRGELPMFLAQHASAAAAAEAFADAFRPADFNPCWLLAGDRDSLHYIDMSGVTDEDRATARALSPGLHILENRELDAVSPKSRHVRRLLDGVERETGEGLVAFLSNVLRNHEIPEGAEHGAPREDGFVRPAATEAACVHAGPYGTRSSSIVLVPSDRAARPVVHIAEGRPCETPLRDVTKMWEG
ncbi:MAG: NRDE family protein [Polyangiaceae bacterium]